MNEESKLTRRVFFRGAATLAGAALVAAVIPVRDARAQQKLAKDVMKYQDTPKDGQRCDECVYWKAPNACGLVEGTIAPAGWCTAYNKKK
jgi:High potential iron-sulfur protein